jgi:hypothetical protein
MLAITALRLTSPALRLKLLGLGLGVDFKALESTFTQLEAFEMSIGLSLASTASAFRHSSLRILHLRNLSGEGIHLQYLIQQLPSFERSA